MLVISTCNDWYLGIVLYKTAKTFI